MIHRIGKTTIAAGLILAGVLAIGLLIFGDKYPVQAETLETEHSSWHLLRETADEDGATKAAVYDLTTAGDFANKDSSTLANGGPFRIRSMYSGIGASEGKSAGAAWMFAICGENFNNVDDTFSFTLVGWSKTNGMIQTICEGDGVLGTQAVVVYPDGGDALGATASETSVSYDDAGGVQDNYFTVTNDGFADVVAGMLAYVTGTNITSGYYQVTVVTDDNNIKIAVTATDDNTDSTVQINPAFWADTINLDETDKWPSVGVFNSGDNEVAILMVDMTGLEWVQLLIYDADGATGEEAGNITAYGRRY